MHIYRLKSGSESKFAKFFISVGTIYFEKLVFTGIIRQKILSTLIMHEYTQILSTTVSFCPRSKQDRYTSEQTDQRRRNV